MVDIYLLQQGILRVLIGSRAIEIAEDLGTGAKSAKFQLKNCNVAVSGISE